MTFAPIQNRLGVQPVGTTVTCVNKSGTSVAIGDLVITSFIHAGAVVNPEQAGNAGYVFNCVRKAVSTESGNTGYLGVVTGLMSGAGGNGREVEVQFGGICSAKVLVNATVTPGTLLGVSTTAGVLTNAVTASGYSVTLMDNAAVADGTAIKRVYIPQEYSFNATQADDGPVVYGSSRAGQFLSDLAAGTDSLDVVILGDSNTGSAIGGMWGYHAGFSQTFNDRQYQCYGLPIYPAMTEWGLNDYGLGGWNASAYLSNATGNLLNGNVSGDSTAYTVWNPGDIATVTISNASPAVITYTAHGLQASDPVFLTTTALLPAGLSNTLTGVAVAGTAGQFSCTAVTVPLAVSQPVRISGTFTNGNSITAYVDPTVYYIIATNGSTTFTLSATRGGTAVTTVVGSSGIGAAFNVSNTGFTYWVKDVLTPDTFTICVGPQGSAVNTSSAGVGTHTIQTGTWVRYGSATGYPPAKDSWAYIASGTYTNNYNGVEMNGVDAVLPARPHPLNSASLTLHHRVVYGTFATGSGSFQGRSRQYGGSPVYASGPVQSTVGAAYSSNVYEYQFTPNGNGMSCSWSGGAAGATGPCAILTHTVYCKRKGWSVTSHGYLAGYNSVGIESVITTIGSTLLREHLKELRTRQTSGTGSGRVLLVVHSGINGTAGEQESAARWTSCHLAVWNTYKAAWSALGYPATDLAIVSFVGEPKNADDSSNNSDPENLIPVRTAANAMAVANPDMTVVDVKKLMNYQQLVYVPIGGANFYQAGSSNVHLSGGASSTTDGYTVVSNMIVSALLATV
jgi:hypothetical protein